MCTTTELSETAKEVVKFTGMENRLIPLEKNIRWLNVISTGIRDPNFITYRLIPPTDTIIIGNVDGESYVETIKEAEDLGFSRAGHWPGREYEQIIL